MWESRGSAGLNGGGGRKANLGIQGDTFYTAKIVRGAGKARFNVATPTNATVTCTAYVLPYNFQTKSI